MPEEVKQDRWNRLMALQADISAERLQRRIGATIEVLVDQVEGDSAVARSAADAPEIDGVVHIGNAAGIASGDLVRVKVTAADDYDLHAVPAGE